MDDAYVLTLEFLKQFNFYVFFNDTLFRKLQKKTPEFYKQNNDILGCPEFREPRLLFQLKNENIDETINEDFNYKKAQNHYITFENLEQLSILTLFSQDKKKDKQRFIQQFGTGIRYLDCGYLGVGCVYVDLENVNENFKFFENAVPRFNIDVGDDHFRRIYEFYLVVSRKDKEQCKLPSPYTNTKSLNPILVPVYYKSKKAKSRSKKIKKSTSKSRSKKSSTKSKSKKVGLRSLRNLKKF
jgi:hypothetical protein